MIANRRVSKCRVRIAHADFQRGMKRVRGAHPTTGRTLIRGPRPASHSRVTFGYGSRG